MSENDYKLFGLDSENATIAKAKTAYYNLALLIHPDKNITINKNEACKEMCILTKSYNNIIIDITNRNRNEEIKNCNDLKIYHQNTQNILDDSITNMPSFSEIFHETHEDIQKFNKKWFEKIEKNKGDIDETQYIIDLKNGYNLCKSEYSYINSNSDESLEYDTEIILDTNFNEFKYSKERSLINIDDLNLNYVQNFSDYKEAFAPNIIDSIPESIVTKYTSNENSNIIEEFQKKKAQYLESSETKRQLNFRKNIRQLNY